MVVFFLLLFFVGISAGLARYFISHDRGEKEPIGALWLALGFGFAGAVAAFGLELLLIPSQSLTASAPLGTIFSSALSVGIIEEACKFLPLSFFLYNKRYFNEHTDGIIYFALAGLGFGLPENILYTLQYGSSAGFGRVILTPFFHAAITGMVGYYLVKGKMAHQSRFRASCVLILAMVLHGLYDFGLISGVAVYTVLSITITLSLSAMLFVFYSRATELDQKVGLSVVGHNSFCRSCGFANPKHHLYCSRCGKRA
jgi:RsiW-degrading membrane proteinase PrsW (M82 family)